MNLPKIQFKILLQNKKGREKERKREGTKVFCQWN